MRLGSSHVNAWAPARYGCRLCGYSGNGDSAHQGVFAHVAEDRSRKIAATVLGSFPYLIRFYIAAISAPWSFRAQALAWERQAPAWHPTLRRAGARRPRTHKPLQKMQPSLRAARPPCQAANLYSTWAECRAASTNSGHLLGHEQPGAGYTHRALSERQRAPAS